MYCFFFSSLALLVWLGQRDGETGEMGELESSSSEGEKRGAMEREREAPQEQDQSASQSDRRFG